MLELILALIPLLPLLASVWIAISFLFFHNRGEKGEKKTARVILIATSLSLLLVFIVDIVALLQGTMGSVILGQWLTTGQYSILISFFIDPLSLVMMNLIAVLGVLMTHFSVPYIHREAGFQRFFMVLALLIFAMQLIVMAGNLVLVFVGWEFAGVSSYLLISYRWERDIATENALRAFVTNRVGDAGFLFAIVISFFVINTTEWQTLLSTADNMLMDQIVPNLYFVLIPAALMLAALIKSAQFPFSAWITRALEGPTSSSAIFYGALMVHAGVYLLIRIEPLISIVGVLQGVLIVLGLASVVYGYLCSLVQTDVKTAFIFSVIAQIGLMLIEIAFGFTTLALAHLVIHAIWRSYQFLHAPSFLHQITQVPRPAPQWLQKRTWLYTAALQRFWLDPLTNYLFVAPAHAVSQDAQVFEDKVITRFTGKLSYDHMITSLAVWEQRKAEQSAPNDIGKGYGFLGQLMETVASFSQWLEEKLLFHTKDKQKGRDRLRKMTDYVESIELLFMQPRYLVLFIVITFVMVL